MNEVKYLDDTGVQSVINETKNRLNNKQDIIQYDTMPTASVSNLGTIAQFTGTTTQDYMSGYFYKCVSDGAVTPTYSWQQINVQAGGSGTNNIIEGYRNPANGLFYEESTYTTAITGAANTEYIDIPNNKTYRWNGSAFVRLDEGDTIQYATMPTAGAEYLGDIVQFVGTTTQDYTNGYFYKCITDGTNYSWVEVKLPADGVWRGTQAEYAIAASAIPNDTVIEITDKVPTNPAMKTSKYTKLLDAASVPGGGWTRNVPIAGDLRDYDLVIITARTQQISGENVTIICDVERFQSSLYIEGEFASESYRFGATAYTNVGGAQNDTVNLYNSVSNPQSNIYIWLYGIKF